MSNQKEIDRATDALRAGDLRTADRSLRRVLKKAPRDPDALHLLGLVELRRDRPERAVVLIERAIEADPRPHFFHNNHGESLRASGRYDDALIAFGNALKLKPDYPEAHNGRGNALRDLGRTDEARDAYETALEHRPGWVPALTNLGALCAADDPEQALLHYDRAERAGGTTAELDHRAGAALSALGRVEEAALRLARAVQAEPANLDYRRTLARALWGLRFGETDPWFAGFVAEAIADPRIEPEPLVIPALSLLEAIPEVRSALEGGDLPTVDVPLLRALLSACVVPDPPLQRLVERLRRRTLGAPDATDPRLAAAVALQCYDTDYVADCPEQSEVDALRARIEGAPVLNARHLEPQLLALAAYQRLCELENAEDLAALEGWSDAAKPVIEATLRGPLDDRLTAAEVPALTDISDAVSNEVRAHYEVNPYPRWRRGGAQPMRRLLEHLGRRPGFQAPADWPDTPRVLVAGCGTGQQPVDLACAFPELSILAIDLSRASLAYAVRMAFHHGVADRIDFAQADLLATGVTEERFDLVESVGVLHHLADPLQGWRVLRGLTKPGGVMRIGLYSEKARALVVQAREAIADLGLEPTPADIRRFRHLVWEDPAYEHLRPLAYQRDFHDLSMCRDLLFHQHEHRFDIPTLRAHLETLDLRFLGFDFRDIRVRARFEATHPDGWADLQAWDTFETQNPDVFRGMYQFYCQAE